MQYLKVISQYGITGLYKGFWPLFWREMPAWGVYFWAYEYLKQSTAQTDNFYYNYMMLMVSGGIAG